MVESVFGVLSTKLAGTCYFLHDQSEKTPGLLPEDLSFGLQATTTKMPMDINGNLQCSLCLALSSFLSAFEFIDIPSRQCYNQAAGNL
jgi:hypothetical protein